MAKHITLLFLLFVLIGVVSSICAIADGMENEAEDDQPAGGENQQDPEEEDGNKEEPEGVENQQDPEEDGNQQAPEEEDGNKEEPEGVENQQDPEEGDGNREDAEEDKNREEPEEDDQQEVAPVEREDGENEPEDVPAAPAASDKKPDDYEDPELVENEQQEDRAEGEIDDNQEEEEEGEVEDEDEGEEEKLPTYENAQRGKAEAKNGAPASPAKVVPPPPLAQRRAPLSLLQACRSEVPRVCSRKKAIVKCLIDQVDTVADATCRTWIKAYTACTSAMKSTRCSEKDSPRRCLHKVAKSELSSECADSDYYKSVRMFALTKK